MGLDAVEIVMDLEERFGITLPDAECSQLRTIADLAALVIARHPRSTAACPTAHRFFELRAAITRITGVGRARVRPATPLSELFPPAERRRWRTLRRQDPRLPALVVAPRADRALLALSVALFGATLACGTWLFASLSAPLAAPLTLAAILLAVLLVVAATSALSTHFPPHFATIGDIARATAPIPPPGSSPGERLIAQQRILDEVRRITAERLVIPLDRVKPESDLVRDLGMA